MTKMAHNDSFGLPEMVVDILKRQNMKENSQFRYKLFCSGNFTELKLQWIDMGQCLPNQVTDGLPDRQWGPRYHNKPGRPRKYKPPSSYRRDAARKEQYQHRMKVATTVDVATQHDVSGLDSENVDDQKGVTTRSKSKTIKCDIEKPRNSDDHISLGNISLASVMDNSDISIDRSPNQTQASLKYLDIPSVPSEPGASYTQDIFNTSTPGLSMEDHPNEDNKVETNQENDVPMDTLFQEYMDCNFISEGGRHFDHYQDMLFCQQCKIVLCKLCYYHTDFHAEHKPCLKWIQRHWIT